MKKIYLFPLLAACIAVFGSSCYSTNSTVHTKRGTVVGGLLGAGAGALIGEHNDRELEGAAIGGVLGALTGSVLGSARDEQYYGRQQPRYYNNNHSYPPPYRSYNSGYHHTTTYNTIYRSGGGYHSGYHSGYRRAPSRSYRSAPYCR